MVVPLLALSDSRAIMQSMADHGIVVRRAKSIEMSLVCDFVNHHWEYWTDEVHTAFSGSPTRVFVATSQGTPVGFSAYDVDYLGVFGPTGVDPAQQGRGIGAALLLRCLEAMREAGYLYAIIGAVGPADFYNRVAGAISLPREWPNFTDPDQG